MEYLTISLVHNNSAQRTSSGVPVPGGHYVLFISTSRCITPGPLSLHSPRSTVRCCFADHHHRPPDYEGIISPCYNSHFRCRIGNYGGFWSFYLASDLISATLAVLFFGATKITTLFDSLTLPGGNLLPRIGNVTTITTATKDNNIHYLNINRRQRRRRTCN